MTRSGPIARGLAASLRAAPVDALDQAGVALARHYAALLDNAAPAAKYVKALRLLQSVVDGADDDARGALELISKALGAHSVASDLGPKLGALLTALGLTPAGRKITKGEERPDVPNPVDSAPPAAGADELEQLRRERAERAAAGQHRT